MGHYVKFTVKPSIMVFCTVVCKCLGEKVFVSSNANPLFSKHTFSDCSQRVPFVLHQSTTFVSKVSLVYLDVVSHTLDGFCDEVRISV